MTSNIRIRKNIRDLEDDYYSGNNLKPLEDLIRAFYTIQQIPPNGSDADKSFFTIAGYHGEPFRGAGWGSPAWWGGYCHHGNVLFPVWHRMYLLQLERALRSVENCSDVTIPYWDELDEETSISGLPRIFLEKKFTLDGEQIDNPLYSYTFLAGVYDNANNPDGKFGDYYDYTKPPGYKTVRYPYSGLAGDGEADAAEVHNEDIDDNFSEEQVNELLNKNIKNWLGDSSKLDTGKKRYNGYGEKYKRCLKAPNYTVFSNTTSATQWNEDHYNGAKSYAPEGLSKDDYVNLDHTSPDAVVPLETPHNGLHLAIGGYEIPGGFTVDSRQGANGDMGENETAAFDPIFFFHHAFIDKLFWQWQTDPEYPDRKRQLEVIPEYPGTNSVDLQGPTPGVPGNTWLTMDSPLDPFHRTKLVLPTKKGDHPQWADLPVTGRDLVDINHFMFRDGTINESYDYDSSSNWPSFGGTGPVGIHGLATTHIADPAPTPMLRISGINRAEISGSFLVSIWASSDEDEGEQLIDVEPILSRWHTQGCANCQTHLNVKTFVPLHGWAEEKARAATFRVKLHTRKNPAGDVKFEAPKGRGKGIGLGRLGKRIGGPPVV
jgi:tyrosinase